MARIELIMPKMGESVSEATIISWSKKVGDLVEIDETIIEIATDKVDSEVPSTHEGKLVEMLFNVDDVVNVGQAFAILETTHESDSVGQLEAEERQEDIAVEELSQSIEQSVEKIVEDFRRLIVRLKDILNFDNEKLSKLVKQKNSQKPWETLVVSENLSWDQFSKINFHLHELPGAKPVISVGRSYPFGEVYTHVLGYVSQASSKDILNNEIIKDRNVPGLRVGKSGLEKNFENELIGTNGVQRYEVNAFGKRINQIDFKEGNKGKTINLTIDTEIQKLTSELLKDKAGSISIMDIYTGEIIAMNSSPSFLSLIHI